MKKWITVTLSFASLFLIQCSNIRGECLFFSINTDTINLNDITNQTIQVDVGCPILEKEVDSVSILQGDRIINLQNYPNKDRASITANVLGQDLRALGFSQGEAYIIVVRTGLYLLDALESKQSGDGIRATYYQVAKKIILY